MPLNAPLAVRLPGSAISVAQDHIKHEEGAVREGEHEPERLIDDAYVSQRSYSTHCQHQG